MPTAPEHLPDGTEPRTSRITARTRHVRPARRSESPRRQRPSRALPRPCVGIRNPSESRRTGCKYHWPIGRRWGTSTTSRSAGSCGTSAVVACVIVAPVASADGFRTKPPSTHRRRSVPKEDADTLSEPPARTRAPTARMGGAQGNVHPGLRAPGPGGPTLWHARRARRLLGRIDGDALDRALGRWPADGRVQRGGPEQSFVRTPALRNRRLGGRAPVGPLFSSRINLAMRRSAALAGLGVQLGDGRRGAGHSRFQSRAIVAGIAVSADDHRAHRIDVHCPIGRNSGLKRLEEAPRASA